MKENQKLFTDPFGKFQMLTPLGYHYKNPGFERGATEPHAFSGYVEDFGAFQISCKPVNEHIAEQIMKRGLKIQSASKFPLDFTEYFFDDDKMPAYMWMAAVEDHFALATYVYPKKVTKLAAEEINNIRECLQTFKFIKPEFREIVLANRRYNLFMASMLAVIELRNKTIENGSFIELVILTANRIDALLRLALMLKNQIENKNAVIDTALLFQDEQDKVVMERAVYRMVLDRGIIDQKLYDSLETLYKERNKVVHRYIITDLRTEQVISIAYNYSEAEDKIDKIINDLEMQQFNENVGLHANAKPGQLDNSSLQRLKVAVKDKHGDIKWEQRAKE